MRSTRPKFNPVIYEQNTTCPRYDLVHQVFTQWHLFLYDTLATTLSIFSMHKALLYHSRQCNITKQMVDIYDRFIWISHLKADICFPVTSNELIWEVRMKSRLSLHTSNFCCFRQIDDMVFLRLMCKYENSPARKNERIFPQIL